ncbi:MAG: hypothetical protein ABW203_00840 [Novosphingobium sp.]
MSGSSERVWWRAGVVALLGLAVPAHAAQSAAAPCVSVEDVQAMAAYALPSAMDGLIMHCSPHLAPSGFLRSQGPALVARYAAGKQAAWPQAKRALLQIAGEKQDKSADLIADLPDASLQPFVEGLIGGMIGKELKPEQCSLAERLVRLLSPLPPGNMIELVGLLVEFGSKDKKPGPGGLKLCPR